MNLHSVTLYTIQMPLKTPFSTHLGTVQDREAIIIEVTDQEGRKGYGEAVAFSSPWYTEETLKTSYHMLKDFLLPLVKKEEIKHPSEVTPLFERVRRNQMAKASVEMALWDLQAKKEQVSLSKLLGGTKKQVASGVVVGAKTTKEMLKQIEAYLEDGYRRVKIKVNPENDYEYLSEVRNFFPNVQLMADANSSYSIDQIEQLKALDEFGLIMIEQPFAHDDIVDHAKLQKELRTPICLDESIVTFADARKAIELGSCKVINIKISRVGGIQTAKAIHDYCMEKDIQVWCGGMLEFGISRAHNIALASLDGFSIPGDISATKRYWDEDITRPEVVVKNGYIDVPTNDGIGFDLNAKRLNEVLVAKEVIQFQ
ncbi:o-succinylbenzoate synthase [bacterium LRH843]|nr:o-succinylbenzoate synthase [bacterium LRH843]